MHRRLELLRRSIEAIGWECEHALPNSMAHGPTWKFWRCCLWAGQKVVEVIRDRAELTALRDASANLENSLSWGRVYEALLADCDKIAPQTSDTETQRPTPGDRRLGLRKAIGAYYTPAALIEVVLEGALDPVIEACWQRGETIANAPWTELSQEQRSLFDGEWTRCQGLKRSTTSAVAENYSREFTLEAVWTRLDNARRQSLVACAELLGLRVCDPAMGSGAFLLGAQARLARSLAQWRLGVVGADRAVARHRSTFWTAALRDVTRACLWGVDRDFAAVDLTRWLLAEAGGLSPNETDWHSHLRWGDSLLSATWDRIAGGLPDVALTTDDGATSGNRSLRARNRRERRSRPMAPLVTRWSTGTQVAESATSGARDAIRPAGSSASARLTHQLFDAWVAAFFQGDEALTPASEENTARHTVITHQTLVSLVQGKAIDPRIKSRIEEIRRTRRPFHWSLEFSTITARGGFDVILGNPPFVNAIEGGMDRAYKRFAKATQPHLHGTADLGYRFLDAALDWVNAEGRIGFVLPRACLNASALRTTRQRAMSCCPPSRIYAPARKDFFPGAQVYVCGLVLGHDSRCRVSLDSDPTELRWLEGEITSDNWWQRTLRIARGEARDQTTETCDRLSDAFEIGASLITRDAYDLRTSIVDREHGVGTKFITTGLIDPGSCLWGTVTCRFLKSDYRFPRVEPSAEWTASLGRRLEKSRRPKVLVAGLSSRVEAMLDAQGDFMGSVSTYSIFHPLDDRAELERLCAWLNAPACTQLFREQLGGNAMGGGNITMSKSFLAELPWPVES
ncbi:MAG: hypothetical protein KDA83_09915 [Planctomycetales bacterium]|nr:hypothetical protein [Planctomycetales bacterium]